MEKNKRSLEILELLKKNGSVKVSELAGLFQTSEMTIRRDLSFLSNQYNIARTHGGAMLSQKESPIVKTISFDEGRVPHKQSKMQIARKAASLILPGQRIFVDAGSTTTRIINYLEKDARNVIVTNNIRAAIAALEYEKVSVIVLGGEVLRIANCSPGTTAEEQVKKYKFDIAFIGAAAVGSDGKLYDGYSPEARLKESIFSLADKIYLLVDSSKFNIYDLNSYGALQQVSGVITDSGVDEKALGLLRKHNVQAIISD